MIYGIDPGLQGTGLAIFYEGKLRESSVHYPKGDSWEQRAAGLYYHLCGVFRTARHSFPSKEHVVVIESPQFFGSRHGDMVARSGDLVKLSYAAAMSFAAALSEGWTPVTVEPNTWKGSMSKTQVITRVRKLLKEEAKGLRTHAWDAAGLVLWYRGKFNGRK
jgi:Holliday junction resolvasome RuvABC endonuclease subunit